MNYCHKDRIRKRDNFEIVDEEGEKTVQMKKRASLLRLGSPSQNKMILNIRTRSIA